MKVFERATNYSRFKGSVTEQVSVPSIVGVHEDGISESLHKFSMSMSDADAAGGAKAHVPVVVFPVEIGDDEEFIEGYFDDLLPDQAKRTQFLALLTEMRDNGLKAGSLKGKANKDVFSENV